MLCNRDVCIIFLYERHPVIYVTLVKSVLFTHVPFNQYDKHLSLLHQHLTYLFYKWYRYSENNKAGFLFANQMQINLHFYDSSPFWNGICFSIEFYWKFGLYIDICISAESHLSFLLLRNICFIASCVL